MAKAALSPLRVAIIGGGPGGLSSAIALAKLPNTTVTLYEQARELREIGAGIQIGFNCWKVLELLGAAENVKGHVQDRIVQRNGKTGEALNERISTAPTPKYRGQRVRRTRLQRSLISKVAEGVIKLQKRLVSLEDLRAEGVRLLFEDGEEAVADLVVGGDGIRSVDYSSSFAPQELINLLGSPSNRIS
jgi:salicylate hydroxylase